MANPKPTVPAAKAGTGTPPAGGNPTPPTSDKDKFVDGSELRDGSTADAKYTAVVVAENADATVTTEAASAALFDEQGLDPYEVNNAV